MVELASDFLDRYTPVFRDDVCFFISQSGNNNTHNVGIMFLQPVSAHIFVLNLRTPNIHSGIHP